MEDLKQDIQQFQTQITEKLASWRSHLETAQSQGKRVVIWGSGSKCVAFLTTLDAADAVDYVVDINPHRHGKFIPGVGHEIRSPDSLKDAPPEQIIIMNSIYRSEIQGMLETMGITTELLTL